ncbi:MAG TPA: formate dehydrogenase accessory sulfurtransferase FdhD [Actinomycetales bacterium]|nr:formate dehydrogenase accessory sulfurtransferase FdhD [Actinomycetales bacterium]
MGRVTSRTPASRIEVGADGVVVTRRPDTVTAEEPLEVRVAGKPLAVTMRTPGDDFDLALGFLVTEGLVAGAGEVSTLMHCQDEGEDGRPTYNVVDVVLQPGVALPDVSLERSFYTTSSCGVCGKASLDAVRLRTPYDVATDATHWSPELLVTLPDALRSHQKVFDRTGGLHAAGLFAASGELLAVREDVGRHNAVDKLVGWAAREQRLPLTGCVLMVSGRASFELTQKALMAGIPCLAAVSAPSSLAVDLATEAGMTLVGFLRPPRMTVYAGEQRLGVAA